MQSIYYKDQAIHRKTSKLPELGISNNSELDFCIDGELTTIQCIFNNKMYDVNHSERCLVSLFSQSIFSVHSGYPK